MTDRKLPSLADVAWPMRTERLLLRPAARDDLEAMWSTWRGREDVARFTTNPWPELGTYLERFAEPEKLATVLVVEHEGRIIMDLHVRIQDSYGQSDVADAARATQGNLGWSMDPEVQGRGLATEALRAGLGICFDHLGLHRVEAGCFTENASSWRLMERVGMRREGHFLREAMHRDLGWTDTYAYGMLDSDWKALAT